MKIADSTVLVTGASRGLGKSLVEGALRKGAKRVYAGVRQSFVHADKRVTPLTLDVTSAAQIRAAVGKVDALDILINNAGISLQNDLRDRAALERLLAVNLFGTYDVTQAFLPVLSRSRSAIVNVLSLAGLAAVPFDSLYSISKAATFSLSQSLRALLAGRGVSVHVVLPGPIDTDMVRGLDIPKASPEVVAQAIFDGLENGEEENLPRPDVGGDRRWLAQQCREGAPATVRSLRRTITPQIEARVVTGPSRENEGSCERQSWYPVVSIRL